MAESHEDIRVAASLEEFQQTIEIAANTFGACDGNDAVFWAADQTAHFQLWKDDRVVACVSVFKLSAAFNAVGMFVVHPDFRGQGLGLKIWDHAWGSIDDGVNVGLCTAPAMAQKYKKYGFQQKWTNVRFTGTLPHGTCKLSDSYIFRELTLQSINQLTKYDAEIYSLERKAFLEAMLEASTASVCVSSGENICGFAIARKSGDTIKIGPFYANHRDLAHGILAALATKVGTDVECEIKLPKLNQRGMDLFSVLGWKRGAMTPHMFTKGAPLMKTQFMFGISSFELG